LLDISRAVVVGVLTYRLLFKTLANESKKANIVEFNFSRREIFLAANDFFYLLLSSRLTHT
jgi:hypothetical protein